jgi:hypothetical protein
LVENSIVRAVNLFIIIRNLAAFYNYNFEIGNRAANGKRQTADGEGYKGRAKRKTAYGERQRAERIRERRKAIAPGEVWGVGIEGRDRSS